MYLRVRLESNLSTYFAIRLITKVSLPVSLSNPGLGEK